MDTTATVSSVGLPLGAAILGSAATASGTESAWYKSLAKPAIQPPPIVFPIAWTILYAQTAIGSGIAQAHMSEEEASTYRRKLALNMALAASSIDLARSAGSAGKPAGLLIAPYAGWTTFATVLTAAIWGKNRRTA